MIVSSCETAQNEQQENYLLLELNAIYSPVLRVGVWLWLFL